MNAVEELTILSIRDHTSPYFSTNPVVLLASSHQDGDKRKKRAYAKVVELVEKYQEVAKDKERIEKYKEEKTKKEFIEPLFQALGWDIENRSLHDEVTEEEKISKGRVDYGFRLNGIPKFYLEAKGLRENLDNREFIQQAINYSWNKGCTWAVLTDFKKIKIFNSEVVCPDYSQNRFIEMDCMEFLDDSHFDELWSFLSKEGFEHGLLDKVAEKWGKKRKRITIDKQLLDDFMHFRIILSDDIRKLNKELTIKDVDEAVQKMLDRLVFIRSCEDKELEEIQLWSIRAERMEKQKIKRLRQTFSYYVKRYNSKIFADSLCDEVDVDNSVLDQIIDGLYWTKDRTEKYDFSFIEADVLGSIYEQYLGHILKKAEKDARLIDGSEHRKQMGIYYTPSYVVDYIVKNTLGKLLENKKIKPEKIKVLDPACGSGSFLTKAYDSFIKQDKGLAQTRLDLGGEDVKYAKKMSILENNIYGVDLDKQAIEITNLDLFLKIATRGKKLPQLPNIKQGNFLIDDPKIAGDLAFKWKEKFPEIIKKGGFDVIIGNPPYIFAREKIDEKQKEFFIQNYETSEYQLNTYVLFIERSIKLLKKNGTLGFIIPDAWLKVESATKLRKFMLENTYIKKIIHIRGGTFSSVGVESSIFILEKTKQVKKTEVCTDLQKLNYSLFSQEEWLKNKNYEIEIFSSKEAKNILDKIKLNTEFLNDVSNIKAGLQAYEKGKGEPKQTKQDVINRPYDYDHKFDKDTFKYLDGKNIGRYSFNWEEKWLRYGEWLAARRSFELFSSPRILVREIPANPPYAIVSSYLEEVYLNNRSIINILQKDNNFNLKYILGILNSKLMTFYHLNKSVKAQRDLFPKITLNDLRKFPIKISSAEKRESIINLVDNALLLNKKLAEFADRKTDERIRIEEQINKNDIEIDEMVYGIYGITENEKEIIENSLK